MLNAIVLGIEAIPSLKAYMPELLIFIDHCCTIIFIMEISLKIFAFRQAYFRSPWNIFEALIIFIAIFPAYHSYNIVRSFRIIRVMLIFRFIPQLRMIIETLLRSMSSILGVLGLLFIVFHIFAVIGVHLFSKDFPKLFDTLGSSYTTLFQIMTLEGWAENITWPIWDQYPYAWIYFIVFIFLSTLIFLNLILGIVVAVMQEHRKEIRLEKKSNLEKQAHIEVVAKLRELQKDLDNLKINLHQLTTSSNL
ncbi:MAG: ion transporter [Alphaproteobacteria bacterium]|nr:ion transporter [Alphaproteobacteria bacterium]